MKGKILFIHFVFASLFCYSQSSGTFTGSLSQSGTTAEMFTLTSPGNGRYVFSGIVSSTPGVFSATDFVASLDDPFGTAVGVYSSLDDEPFEFFADCLNINQQLVLRISLIANDPAVISNYTLDYQFIPSTYTADIEPNDTYDQAIDTVENINYEGFFNSSSSIIKDNIDWYKLTANNTGKLKISVISESIGQYTIQPVSLALYDDLGMIVAISFSPEVNGQTTTYTYENFDNLADDFGIELSGSCNSYSFSWEITSTATTPVPDVNFEQLLIDLGYDDILDGSVLVQNIENVTTLDISSKNISDITGIEGFSSLTEFTSIQNPLTTVDLRGNRTLEKIVIINNPITTINLTSLTNLTELTVSSQTNTLETISVSTLTNLTLLELGANNLSNLGVGNLTQLTYLNFGNNPISFINLSNNPALEFVGAYNTLLTELDLSNNTAIESVSCHSNAELERLDVKNGLNNDTNGEVILNSVLATNNPRLFCIQVDDVANAQSNPNWQKDAVAIYSEDCMYDATLTDPTNLTVSSITSDAARIDWTTSIGNTGGITYSIFLNSTLFATTTSTSLDLSGLSPLTPYDIAVSAEDTSGKTSGQATTTFITLDITGQPIEIASYYFEDGLDGWIDGGSDCGRVNRTAIAFEGNFSIGLRDNSNSSQAISPQLDLSGNSEVSIEFHVFANSMEPGENFFVEFFNGSSFEVIGDYARGIDFGNNEFFSATILLDATFYDFNTANRFRFRNDASDNGDRIFFDAVVISGLSMEGTRNSEIANFNVSTSELLTQNNEELIILYPNPVTNTLTIKLLENKYDEFTIFSSRGHKIRRVIANDSLMSIDVSDLLEGMYFVAFQANDTTIFKRFIKK